MKYTSRNETREGVQFSNGAVVMRPDSPTDFPNIFPPYRAFAEEVKGVPAYSGEGLIVEWIDEELSPEEQETRKKTLQLVKRLEHLAQTDEGFRVWLQTGFAQIEAGQTVDIDLPLGQQQSGMVIAVGEVTQEAQDFLNLHGASIHKSLSTGIYLIAFPETARLDCYWGVEDIVWFDEDDVYTRNEGISILLSIDVRKAIARYVRLDTLG